MVIFRVTHKRELGAWGSREFDTKKIGYFADADQAVEAIERLAEMDGFREHPGGFCIRRVLVDHNLAIDEFAATIKPDENRGNAAPRT